jgi:two-component system sensor histidine kinase/response regulator
MLRWKIRELSLRKRLLLLTMITSGVSMLLGYLGFLAYDTQAIRAATEEEIRTAAGLVGTNCTAALVFDDARSGTTLLAALRTRQRVRIGVLYRPDGSVFAAYYRADLANRVVPPVRPADGMVWKGDRLLFSSPVILDNQRVGTLYLERGLTDLQERLRRFEQMTAGIALGSLFMVYFLTAALQQSVTKPILNLAQIARSIAAAKSYAVRAPVTAGGELRQLSADFNHMLEEIQGRDKALQEAHDVLELRVTERTRELEGEVKERRRAEWELQQQTNFLNTLIAADPMAILVCSADERVELANPAFSALFGYTQGEILHKNIRDLIFPLELRREGEIRVREITSGQSSHGTSQRRKKSGQLLDLEIHAVPLTIEGRQPGMLVLYQDISERVKAQHNLREAKEAAEAASRAKSEFLANMSHEIRTPMNGILGMTELALDTDLGPEQREYLDMVKSSAESLLEIINDILDFSKIEAGHMELETLPFSVLDCIESALEPLAFRAHQKGLELNWGLLGEIPDVLLGDAMRLRQILINLTGNAIKFTREGHVTVSAEGLPPVNEAIPVRVTVSDTGIGIPKEKHQQVFGAFSQADSSTTREFGGTGLGLSISAKLIQLMGGTIELQSEPGKGTTFTVTIPFALGNAEAIASRKTADTRFISMKVLVVDDNQINRKLLQYLLPQWGMEPICAESGSEALGLFQKSREQGDPFPLVLLDQNMPFMDGYEVAEKLRAMSTREQPTIIILSSTPTAADQNRAKKLGIERRLLKPLRRGTLLEAIREGLCLPASPASTPIFSKEASGKQGLRLLLVEDNAVNQRLAIRLLEKMGHSVTLAVNGREAVAMFSRETFDLLLMDIQMPVMSGVEATQQIRKQEQRTGGHIPIIAMTANAMAGDAEKYLAAGMDGYVSKPVRTGLLRAEIDRLAKPKKRPGAPAVKDSEMSISQTHINLEELRARAENDRELMRDLFSIFKEEFPQRFQALREAVQSRDAKRVAMEAHTLKGMLSNLAAGKAAGAAADLESLARNGETSKFEESLSAFQSIADEMFRQLDTCMAEVCG